jgi:hypothetical protein
VKTLAGLVSKIQSIPKDKARDLILALNEVHKEMQTIFKEISQYRRLSFERDFEQIAPAVLSELEGSAAITRVNNSKGHCTIIGNLYRSSLSRWFASLTSVLTRDDRAETERIFGELEKGDQGLFEAMEKACEFLRGEARDVADLVRMKKWDEAFKRVNATSQTLRDLEKSFEDSMRQVLALRNEALRRAGVTSLSEVGAV